MKKSLPSIFLWIGGITCNAQTVSYEWANQTGGIGVDGAHAIATDLAGNVYITGSFGETVDFDPGSGIVNLVSGYQDIFIQKLNPSGNLIWVKQMGPGIGVSIITDTLG